MVHSRKNYKSCRCFYDIFSLRYDKLNYNQQPSDQQNIMPHNNQPSGKSPNKRKPQAKKNGKRDLIVITTGLALILLYLAISPTGKNQTLQNAVTEPAPAVKPLIKAQPPRTLLPFEEYTQYFERKDTIVETEKNRWPMTYFMYEPQKPYPDGLTFPLVLILHGTPGKAYAGKYLITGDMPSRFPAFIVAPVAPQGRIWSYPSKAIPGHQFEGPRTNPAYHDLPIVAGMVQQIVQQYPVDPNRVYVIGCSEGGFGTFGAALHYPDLFAAAIAISGGWLVDDTPQMLDTPILIMHGKQDRLISAKFSRNMANAIGYLGGKAHYIEFPDMGHNCPSPKLYSEKIWRWLFSQKKT